jgi:KaiC/GvpD/RAD55 family RecA-like ATPase
MNPKVQLLNSGIPLVDKVWGGLYRGGTYLLVGARKSGRTLLSLQYAMESARQNNICLYFTSMRPKDLLIQAASIDLDLQAYMNQNLIIVVRVAPPSDLYESGNIDDFLAEYLNDIATVVDQYNPQKVVFDELTPFIGFNDLSMLQHSFSKTCEAIEENGITSLYVLAEPASEASQAIVDTINSSATGIIKLDISSDTKQISDGSGVMTIIPNIGHTEGQFASPYKVEPYKGIVIIYPKIKTKDEKDATSNTVSAQKKYKTLAEVEVSAESYNLTLYYNENDFKLILNNQIALFKSTGQVFTLMSFHLDKIAESKSLLTLTQLQNAVRLATDRKDKICLIKKNVVVLITKEDPKSIDNIIGKVKANLPLSQSQYAEELLQHILVYAVKVDAKIRNSDDIIHLLLAEETEEQNKLYSN